MKTILPAALLLGSFLMPSHAAAWEYIKRDEGYRQCMYFELARNTDESEYIRMEHFKKTAKKAIAHKACS